MILPPNCKESGNFINMQDLQKMNLEVYAYSGAKDNVVLLISPRRTTRVYADEVNFKMKVTQVLEKMMAAGDPKEGIGPVTILDPEEAQFPPFELVYLRYSTNVPMNCTRSPKAGKLLSSSVRRRLIGTLIEGSLSRRRKFEDSEIYSVKKIIAYFPLHEPEKIEVLARLWLDWNVMPWCNLSTISRSTLVKIGIYFLFQGHYTRWLIGPAIVGFIFNNYQRVLSHLEGRVRTPYLPIYAAFICIWSIYMLQYWKDLKPRRH